MYYKKKKNLLHPDLIRKVLLSVRQIYVVGSSSCCICIMVTLGFQTRPLVGHLHLITETLWLFANHTFAVDSPN